MNKTITDSESWNNCDMPRPTSSENNNKSYAVQEEADLVMLGAISRNDENYEQKSDNFTESVSSCVSQISKRHDERRTVVRKRTRNKDSWIDVKAKKARSSGIEGIGRTGVPIQSRKMRDGCNDKCRFRCSQKVSVAARKAAFSQFWRLGDRSKQWECITNWVHSETVRNNETIDCDSEKESKKKFISHHFALPDEGKLIKVCKKTFLDTLGISYQWIRTADKKKKYTNSTLIINSDERGKHKMRPHKVPEKFKQAARDHLSSFPVMDSHYCGENTSRKYLEEGLSISKMYFLFREEMRKKCETVHVTEQMYRKIFKTEFNYAFFVPKKYRCEQCEAFQNLSDNEKALQLEIQKLHLRNKKNEGTRGI